MAPGAAVIHGWRTRRGGAGERCASCGHADAALYQGRRYVPERGWEDLPDVRLCDVCRDAKLDAQRARQDPAPPRPWWHIC